MKLTVHQREAIRHFADDPVPARIHGATIQALIRAGLLEATGWDRSNGMPVTYGLTRKGVSEYHRTMASGDGPEENREEVKS